MSVTYNGPVRVFRRRGGLTTNDGSAQTNALGLALGDNTGAALVAQQFFLYQPTAAAGSLVLYRAGVNGNGFVNGVISIPNLGAAFGVIGTIPAGARVNFSASDLILLQAPTAITTGVLTLSLNNTAVATVSIGAGIGGAQITPVTTLAALQLLTNVGPTDAVLTASLAGSGITGGFLAEIAIAYTVRNADGSIVAYGSGLSNDGSAGANF